MKTKILKLIFGKSYKPQPKEFWKKFWKYKLQELGVVGKCIGIVIGICAIFWIPAFFILHRNDLVTIENVRIIGTNIVVDTNFTLIPQYENKTALNKKIRNELKNEVNLRYQFTHDDNIYNLIVISMGEEIPVFTPIYITNNYKIVTNHNPVWKTKKVKHYEDVDNELYGFVIFLELVALFLLWLIGYGISAWLQSNYNKVLKEQKRRK